MAGSGAALCAGAARRPVLVDQLHADSRFAGDSTGTAQRVEARIGGAIVGLA